MGVIKEVKCKALGNEKFMIERYDRAADVAADAKNRSITDNRFKDRSKKENIDAGWTGVGSYEGALELLETGYQPTVDELKQSVKANVRGQVKRTQFFNDVCGFNPIVPLAIQGVPNCMVNSRMTSIKAKVIDVYYDMTACASVGKEDIIKAGTDVLAAIMELEMQGYRFNLYAVQSYYKRDEGCDMLCVKVKSAAQPLDLKRVSFPLTHTAFFRVIGFDWYSRTPRGKYRHAYGCALGYEFGEEQLTNGFKELFGRSAVAFSASRVLQSSGVEHLKEVLTNDGSKN